MNHELQFGVGSLLNVPWNEMVRRFCYFEELGFDVAGTGDHFVNQYNPSSIWFEGWTMLSALAAKTTRIRIGMGITAIPFRNPAFLARQALTVDHISKGRLVLGLGTGVRHDPSYEMTGIPNWSPRERVSRFREYVEIVDQLLRKEVTTYDGRYYKIKNAIMKPRPVQKPRPPIMVAALGPTMLKHTARYADIWNSLSTAETLEEQVKEIHQRNKRIDKHCRQIGRDPTSIRRSLLLTDREARRRGGIISFYESEDAFKEVIGKYVDVGITEFYLYYPFRDEQLPMFEKIAREVIPELKEKYNS